jgi:hypothetical protein
MVCNGDDILIEISRAFLTLSLSKGVAETNLIELVRPFDRLRVRKKTIILADPTRKFTQKHSS